MKAPQDIPPTKTKSSLLPKGDIAALTKASLETQSKPEIIAKSQSKEISLDHFSHSKYCSEAPSGMITKSLAYSSRSRNTTFGKSNRIEFLRQLRDAEGAGTVRPPYPPSYHGPGGEGQQFALGLTLAGSAESDRILGPICTYGNVDRKFHHPRCPTSFPVSPTVANRMFPIIVCIFLKTNFNEIMPAKTYQDPRTAHSMKEFLMLDEDTRLKTRCVFLAIIYLITRSINEWKFQGVSSTSASTSTNRNPHYSSSGRSHTVLVKHRLGPRHPRHYPTPTNLPLLHVRVGAIRSKVTIEQASSTNWQRTRERQECECGFIGNGLI